MEALCLCEDYCITEDKPLCTKHEGELFIIANDQMEMADTDVEYDGPTDGSCCRYVQISDRLYEQVDLQVEVITERVEEYEQEHLAKTPGKKYVFVFHHTFNDLDERYFLDVDEYEEYKKIGPCAIPKCPRKWKSAVRISKNWQIPVGKYQKCMWSIFLTDDTVTVKPAKRQIPKAQ